jgi:dTDP-glucose 4,6-dehydratase
MMYKKILVTGGGGFIGSNFIKSISSYFPNSQILNIDNISYCTSNKTLSELNKIKNYSFISLDLRDRGNLEKKVLKFNPELIVNFAAESHVDNSILNSGDFITTNIIGTYNLLCIANEGLLNLKLFHQISTDEVFGDLDKFDPPFKESSLINPSSPYSASKASADLLVKAWGRTYDLPYLITNCSNNFGPMQYTEKLIPKICKSFFNGDLFGLYGDGQNIRDWIYVKDHVEAIINIYEANIVNESINIGGEKELSNIQIIEMLQQIFLEKYNISGKYEFVDDRPGHDERYAIDNSKINSLLNFNPSKDFEKKLISTVDWYHKNKDWWED